MSLNKILINPRSWPCKKCSSKSRCDQDIFKILLFYICPRRLFKNILKNPHRVWSFQNIPKNTPDFLAECPGKFLLKSMHFANRSFFNLSLHLSKKIYFQIRKFCSKIHCFRSAGLWQILQNNSQLLVKNAGKYVFMTFYPRSRRRKNIKKSTSFVKY